MSDLYIRVIPTDPEWQPTSEAAARAAKFIADLFAGPGDHAEVVEPVFHERISLIDGGEYMELPQTGGWTVYDCPTRRSATTRPWCYCQNQGGP
ncbi:hypothetical protein [Micromonospora sp. HK10]|uniref:hypothetical protein n=1 Tax=Micromonospora sp. HK10 TaxID=1538294 RepID=UPI0006271368|nr:hypothetical protein [Micromonospora sp. HK10]KKK00530.1 hypothetical protein LQ51_21325 [Micromonospora sp. HK10]